MVPANIFVVSKTLIYVLAVVKIMHFTVSMAMLVLSKRVITTSDDTTPRVIDTPKLMALLADVPISSPVIPKLA